MQGGRPRAARQGQRGGHQGRGRGGYKYGANARNNGQGAQPAHPVDNQEDAAPVAPVAAPQSTSGINASGVGAAEPGGHKQMRGEKLFPRGEGVQFSLAVKITGMLREMDNGELLHLIESSEALEAKINEAVSVLQEHGVVEEAGNTEESA
ncbi:Protein phosphatase PP2A regulatory subunit B [Basidiobolus ranarum]|uniref:Protein phosphatase PP2A regulatory subunit B n=1 Tax=Basidiobolus ranarum TaxID=34480 RepID=A0ABR2VLI5_9FUNG